MIKEFICPNGRMSVNGVCPIFEGDDGQIKDFNKPNKNFFEFDFEKPTESSKTSATNILADNISYYNNFVEDTLGIPSNVQNAVRIGTAGFNLATGAGLAGFITPFALPVAVGGFLKNKEQTRIENITMQDPQGDIQTYNTAVMNMQPTFQDKARGGGGNNNQGTFGSSVNEATGARGSGTGFSDYS